MNELDITRARFRLNPRYRFQWEPAQDCYVLLYPEGLIQLSDSAAEIVQCCSEPTSLDELVSQLKEKFPEADSLAADVREFLEDARRERWIVPDAGS